MWLVWTAVLALDTKRAMVCLRFENSSLQPPATSGAERVAGKILPPGFSTGGRPSTCARLLVHSGQCKATAQLPDVASVAYRKRQYIHGLPSAPPLHELPYRGATGCFKSVVERLQASKQQCGSADTGGCAPVAQTDLERYLWMQKAVGMRLTPGKSAIHGMGVFTRAPVCQGEWVIEYMGASHSVRFSSRLWDTAM